MEGILSVVTEMIKPVNYMSEFDFIKGIMIILVIVGHSGSSVSDSTYFPAIVNSIYLFHMPIFLLISGYLFSVKNSFINDIVKIFRSLFVPYFVFSVIYIILLYLLNMFGYTTSTSLCVSYLDGIIYKPQTLWYLHDLFLFRLILIISHLIHQKLNMAKLFVFTLLLLVCFDIGLLRVESVVFLTLGFTIKEYGIVIKRNYECLLLIILVLVGIIDVDDIIVKKVVLSLSFVVFLSQLYSVFQKRVPVELLSYVGRNSLIIYIVHCYTGYLAKNTFLSCQFFGNYYYLYIVVSCSLSVVLSLLFARILDGLHISGLLFYKNNIYSPFR